MENEGCDVNLPPLFKGEKFDYWKQIMTTLFESYHIGMWDVVENGNCVPLNEKGQLLDKSVWSDDQKQRYFLKSEARNSLMCTLFEDEYRKVQAFKGAKEMWGTIVII